MPELELVIFDCDGVLVDSEVLTNGIFLSLLAGYGLTLSLEELVADYVGNSMQAAKDKLYAQHGFVLPDAFLPAFHEASLATLQAELQPVAHVAEAIDALNVPYCLASNSSPHKVKVMLDKTGLAHRFQGRIYTADLVAAPKPAPDIYLHAAKANGVAPEHVLVIEDTHIGIAAAKAAGMTVFGYIGTFPSEVLINAGAHLAFDDMRQLPGLIGQHFAA